MKKYFMVFGAFYKIKKVLFSIQSRRWNLELCHQIIKDKLVLICEERLSNRLKKVLTLFSITHTPHNREREKGILQAAPGQLRLNIVLIRQVEVGRYQRTRLDTIRTTEQGRMRTEQVLIVQRPKFEQTKEEQPIGLEQLWIHH